MGNPPGIRLADSRGIFYPPGMDIDPVLPGYAGTKGLNFWETDSDLREAAMALIPEGEREAAGRRLSEFGALAGGRLGELIEKAHLEENLPRLADMDVAGERVKAVFYCAEQVEARRLLAKAAYGHGPISLAERMTLAILANMNGEGGIGCPFAMTEGLIGLLEKRGSSEQKSLLPRLRSADPDWALTGAQFITERQGGSNVAANEAVAEPRSGGGWSLTGEKWFCSNPGELWVTTARAGSSGPVGLFLVRRRLPDGRLNGHRILRKKAIAGTKGKATVEVEYKGAQGELIGKAREGLVLLVEVLSVSREHVAAAALGFSGRALLEAETFARWRVVYGRRVADMSSARGRLERMREERKGMLKAFYLAVKAVREDSPEADALVPMAKVEISRRASALVLEAQLLIGGHGILEDFSPLPRLLADAVVNEIWEGTHPILAAHAAKALRRPRVLASLQAGLGREKGMELARLVEQNRKAAEEDRGPADEGLCAAAYEAVVSI